MQRSEEGEVEDMLRRTGEKEKKEEKERSKASEVNSSEASSRVLSFPSFLLPSNGHLIFF